MPNESRKEQLEHRLAQSRRLLQQIGDPATTSRLQELAEELEREKEREEE